MKVMKNYKNSDQFWKELKSGKFASMVKESSKGKKIINPEEVYNIIKPVCAKEDDVEQMFCIFLNVQNRIISIEKLFSGSINCTMVHPREILKKVIQNKAYAIILAHNHPGGSTAPSEEDIEITGKIAHAMEIINGKLHDHVIIGDGFTSLSEIGEV